MSSSGNHNKIINAAARMALKPAGAIRKGQSRLWLDDNGWYITLIEFQPSSSPGSLLNIGVQFMWYPKEVYAFDAGYRQQDIGSIRYRNDDQFTPQAQAMAEAARDRMLVIRQQMQDITSASAYIHGLLAENPVTVWTYLHQGMLHLLQGHTDEALSRFRQLLAEPDSWEWALALKAHTQELMLHIQHQRHLPWLAEIVQKSRALKKLPERVIDLSAI